MTSSQRKPSQPRRNRGYTSTHQKMIETAVRQVSEKGIDALSIAGLSRAMGVNRTTVYYHFESREALLEEVKQWSSGQLAKAFSLAAPQQERIDYLTRFVLENPELIKLWVEGLVSGNDIHQSYPLWDELVSGISGLSESNPAMESMDAEVFCITLLVGAIIGPRVFRSSIRPDQDIETIVRRFRLEWQRMLRQELLLGD